MAAAIPLSFSLDPQHHFHSHLLPNSTSTFLKYRLPKPLPFLHKSHRRFCFKSSLSPSDDSSPSSLTATTSLPPQEDSQPTSLIQDPFRSNRFLTKEEYDKLKFLEDFRYCEELENGFLRVRVMRADEMDVTVKLLADSFFGESMGLPAAYVSLLSFVVKDSLTERRALLPHTATLVGFYRGKEKEEEDGGEELAATVEVCFDKRGAAVSPSSPTPPKDKPYICNMTVKKELRRRGIGWHLLKASEKLISEITSSKEVYLHCRMIDTAPFNMYTKAGYNVVKTDSIFILLTLKRRQHLMCKNLPILDDDSELLDISDSDKELNM